MQMAPGDINLSRPGTDLKRALLEAAFDQLDTEGLTRVSVRAAARRLEIPYPAAARQFASRKTLLTEMATATLRELMQRIGDARAGSPPGGEQWRAVGAAAFEYATRAPHRYALCWRFDEMSADDARWRAAGDELCALLRDVLAVRPCDIGDPLVAAGSLLQGYVALRHCGAIALAV
jgi:AcrR family transcriptional regulator